VPAFEDIDSPADLSVRTSRLTRKKTLSALHGIFLSGSESMKELRSEVEIEASAEQDWQVLTSSGKTWLHIDDDTSILLHYNQEKEFIDYWRTRNIPSARATETAMLHAVLTGTASDSFYRKLESLCDGIIEFKTEDKSGEIEHYVRISMMRGRTCDTRWRRVRILESGEVAVS